MKEANFRQTYTMTPDLPSFCTLKDQISLQHGHQLRNKCIHFKNLSTRIAKSESRRIFLLRHRRLHIIPRFILDKSSVFDSLRCQTNTHNTSIDKAQTSFERTILNLEISICIQSLNNLIKEREHTKSLIQTQIDDHQFNDLSICIQNMYDKVRSKSKEKHMRKFQRNLNMKTNSESFSINEDFCINMSGKEIPKEVTQLLGLGQSFATPVARNETPFLELFANTNDIIDSSESDQKSYVRTLITNDYVQYMRKQDKFNPDDSRIRRLVSITNKYLRENPDIYVVNSDKGQKTVIMTRQMYEAKMTEHLQDKNVYIPIPNSKTDINNVLKRRNNDIIEELYVKGQITKEEKTRLTVRDCIPPRIYGTFKTHKPNLPIRPVMSTVNTATRPLCDHILSILAKVPLNDMDVKNSDIFKQKLENITLDDNEECISLDVVSLYTNINQKEAIESCMGKWQEIQEHTTIKKHSFRRLLELCVFESGYFLYKDNYFRQIQGLPMGNPLSGILATFVLNDFLTKFFAVNPPNILCKYVDDMFLIMKKDDIQPMLHTINQAHDTLKFTMEREVDNKLPFLDIMVIREGTTVHTNWYRKPIASGRLLNYLSSHPQDVKKGIAKAFAKRVIRLSHQKYHSQNYTIIAETLEKNNYPKNMINKIIKDIRFGTSSTDPNTSTPQNTGPVKYRGLPYVPILSEKIKHNLAQLDDNIKIGMKPVKKLQRLFTKTKTKVRQTRNGFCYRIKCKGIENDNQHNTCPKTYIGETGRADGDKDHLPPRIKEHRSSFKTAQKQQQNIEADRNIIYSRYRTRSKQHQLQSLMTEHSCIDQEKRYNNAALDHAMHNKHHFDYDNFEIVHYSNQYRRRKALESMYIYMEGDNSINYKIDTTYMHSNTKQLLDVYTNMR